ncbi:tetraacyldisaccharide 4'-kinase [Aestuariibius insulae]|uniref:tetraacyldisaccharide 4'-kinase n=1 Tax=Aestuariibius insulae TaxID=2058287 RepID=UPI00345EDA3F
MKAPAFWYRPPGLQARALQPLGALYAAATARRVARPPEIRPEIPVICIGNLNAGGTGKTPTTIHLAEKLTRSGAQPHIVTRGYGGTLDGPVQVDPSAHTADQTGDEPLLLAAFAPTWVAKDRAAGARAAAAAGATVLLLDDGFQNPAVAKDLSIITVDAAKGFGNGLCLPAGPLREPVEAGLRRADLLLSIGSDPAQQAFSESWTIPLPHLTAELKPLLTGMPWQGLPVLAFAGIGHPEKFFATLRQTGANLIHGEPLADHQALTEPLMARLLSDAKRLNAQLVTTEKDAVRLPDNLRAQVLTLPVRLAIKDPEPLDIALKKLDL